MLVNLSDVFTCEGRQVSIEVPLEMRSFESGMGCFEIMERTPVRFTFTNMEAGKARVEGSVKLTLRMNCDRCLAEVPTVFDLQLERIVTAPEAAADEEAEDDPDIIKGYQLDAETLVHNEIIENWPTKILCKEDCRGLCPVCGQNLNERDCGCDTFVPDPRMAVIQDIFNANKEV